VISPAPESTALSQALRFWYQPYLTLFRLDNMWEFFAPNIGGASQLRYNIEDDAGESQSFVPTEGLIWFHPSYFWIRSWSEAVTTNFGLYGASGAAALCRKHAALHPISITLLEYHEAKIYASGSLERREPHGPRVFRCEGFATLQMHNPVTLARCGRTAFTAIDRAWSRFWFQNSATSPLELARIGIGGALLVNYSLAAPYLFDFWSDSGWIPREIPLKEVADSWAYSVLFCFTAPWHWIAFHSLFLQCCFAFMVGWRTSWVKWIVLVGQISYDYRNLAISYGVDRILASLLFILCLAPIGKALSLDRVRAVRAAKQQNLAAAPPLIAVRGPVLARD
jgi:hypothetical protein